MITKTFNISFYIEGNERTGFYAWQSTTSSKEIFGYGKTVYEAVATLCNLLNDMPKEAKD